jgi:AcrR family transcriptional regulator
MSPRRYRMEKRQASRDETRQRILDAARELLSGDQSPDLSMEAVARRADVSRLTIYYQFTSRAGLLEALYDHLATRGHMQRMPEVFQQANQEQALGKMIEVFAGFWSTDTAVLRRLRSTRRSARAFVPATADDRTSHVRSSTAFAPGIANAWLLLTPPSPKCSACSPASRPTMRSRKGD